MRLEERITCSVREAREATGLGKTKLYELMDEGRLETVKLDGKRLVWVKSLIQLLDEKCPPSPTKYPTGGARTSGNESERMRTKKLAV